MKTIAPILLFFDHWRLESEPWSSTQSDTPVPMLPLDARIQVHMRCTMPGPQSSYSSLVTHMD